MSWKRFLTSSDAQQKSNANKHKCDTLRILPGPRFWSVGNFWCSACCAGQSLQENDEQALGWLCHRGRRLDKRKHHALNKREHRELDRESFGAIPFWWTALPWSNLLQNSDSDVGWIKKGSTHCGWSWSCTKSQWYGNLSNCEAVQKCHRMNPIVCNTPVDRNSLYTSFTGIFLPRTHLLSWDLVRRTRARIWPAIEPWFSLDLLWCYIFDDCKVFSTKTQTPKTG